MASPLNRPGLRAAAASAALTLVALSANVPAAQAIPPPSVDPAMVPADARPGPDQPMRRSNSCSTPITVRNPDVAQLAPGFNLVNISKAWQYSTGNGVPVAVIDTGVSPNPRLPVVPGGDYIMGEDGLSDCDAHGTVVSSIMAAAPLGIFPMPGAMPATAAFPPPAGPPPVTARRAPPGEAPPPMPRRRRCRSPKPLRHRHHHPRMRAPWRRPMDRRIRKPKTNPRCPHPRRAPRTGWWGWPRMRPSSRFGSPRGPSSRSTRRRRVPTPMRKSKRAPSTRWRVPWYTRRTWGRK